jgi:beta-lactamase regulating signal transducer with metallopeptidase domain
MNPLDALANSPLLSLLGWTVLSALTLGAAAAATILLVRSVAPQITSRWQHRLVLSLYAVSFIAALAVASMPRQPLARLTTRSERSTPIAELVIPARPGQAATRTVEVTSVRPSDRLGELVGLLGLLSVGFAIVATGRLLAGLWMVRRLRRNAVAVDDAALEATIASLAATLGIRRRIALRQSAAVDTAITGGWLRPFVLLPPGLAASLGPEIEPVLAHELAHVRRRDFPIAVLQAVADAATRLSPGHRWLSLEASRLREQACDDTVVALGVEPVRYARALEALGTWSRGVKMTYVVCAANRHLASRVRRLLEGPCKPRALAAIGAILLLPIGALAATLVAATAPGLPAPPSNGHRPLLPSTLMSGLDVRHAAQTSGSTGTQEVQRFLAAQGILSGYSFHQPNSPVRIDEVSPSHTYVFDSLVLRNVFAKQITSVMFNAIIERPAAAVVIVSSPSIRVSLDPGQHAEIATRFVSLEEASRFKSDDKVQLLLTVARVDFEDGSQWGAPIDISARSADGAMGIQPVTLPREFVSVALPPNISTPETNCYGGYSEDAQFSPGSIVPIEGETQRFARCVEGRWVEVDPLKMTPEYGRYDMRTNGVIAPLDRRVTLRMSDASLTSIVAELSRQTGVTIAIQPDVPLATGLTVDMRGVQLLAALQQVLEGQSLTYRVLAPRAIAIESAKPGRQ